MSLPLPLDRLPGLTPEEVLSLRQWREMPETQAVLRILAQMKPVSAVSDPDKVTAEGAAFRLGLREGYDALYSQLFMVGRMPEASKNPKVTYGGKRGKPAGNTAQG